MIKAQAYAETEKASRYLQQLCKHFAHKVNADFNETRGKVCFPFGSCDMIAVKDRLVIQCTSDSSESFTRLKYVLDDHLERFAFREKLQLTWMVE